MNDQKPRVALDLAVAQAQPNTGESEGQRVDWRVWITCGCVIHVCSSAGGAAQDSLQRPAQQLHFLPIPQPPQADPRGRELPMHCVPQ